MILTLRRILKPNSSDMEDADIDELDLSASATTDGDDGRELFEHFRFVADKGQQLLRVDKFLVTRIEKSSRNRIQQAADAGCILVNGRAVKSNLPCQAARCSGSGDGSSTLRAGYHT